ncbi:MAG TPA: prolipoprotein diacylglyceryl transferase family protein [Gemmataceae bacterium]|nr:prolipoprotein diacylglyceryl transferase family protein [Gemmataceae bacterium]
MTWVYPALMGAAIATGVVVARRTQKPLGLTPAQRFAVGLGAFCGGMLGAKLPFVLLDWEGFLAGTAWLDNGKTLVLGLVGGYFGVEAAKWALDIRVKTGDSLAAPVAAAIAVGRLACFSGGCCFGTPTDLPWAVDFGDGVRRHPTQLYEFAFHATAAVVLLQLQARGLLRGQLVKLYILAYLAYRFATEFIRPEPRLWLDLSVYQWAALVLWPVFVFLWWRDGAASDGRVEPRTTAPLPT